MPKQNVRFTAVKTVKKPTTVEFTTKSGETVHIKALRTVQKNGVRRLRAKRK